VLDLNVTKTVEPFLISVLEESERVPESERRLRSDLVLESLQGGLLLGEKGGAGEGGSGGEESGEEGELHVFCFLFFLLRG